MGNGSQKYQSIEIANKETEHANNYKGKYQVDMIVDTKYGFGPILHFNPESGLYTIQLSYGKMTCIEDQISSQCEFDKAFTKAKKYYDDKRALYLVKEELVKCWNSFYSKKYENYEEFKKSLSLFIYTVINSQSDKWYYETLDTCYKFCLSCAILGKYPEAIAVCNRFCEGFSIYYKIRGTIWSLQGKKEQAKKDFFKFIEKSTDSQQIEEVLSLLNELENQK